MSEERKENIQTGNPLGEASVASYLLDRLLAHLAMLQQMLPFRLPHPVLHLH